MLPLAIEPKGFGLKKQSNIMKQKMQGGALLKCCYGLINPYSYCKEKTLMIWLYMDMLAKK